MRALTIVSAMLLAMAGGAYAALVVTAGGSDAGEPMVVLPVKPAPVRPAPASPSQAPTVSPGLSQAPASVSSAATPTGGPAAVGTGPAVAGMIAEQPQPPQQQRQAPTSAAGPTTAQAPTTQFPGLSIDLGAAGNGVSGQPAPARSPAVRTSPSNAPAGLGARPAGG